MSHEHAHPTPYYLQKDWWHLMQETPDKGPIRHLGEHILEYDKNHNLEVIANQTHQLHKWLKNKDIDNPLSNNFWTNPSITDKQKTCLIKFRMGTWAMPGSSLSLVEKLTHQKHAPSATRHMQIHGYTYYSNANNNTFMYS